MPDISITLGVLNSLRNVAISFRLVVPPPPAAAPAVPP
jgi:hypothetical protein